MDNLFSTQEIVDLVPFLIKLNRVLSQSAGCADDQNLPQTQFHTLIYLMKYGTLSMTQLSNHIMMQRQQTTQVTQALVKKGLVARKADPNNRRLVLVELTDEGARYFNSIMSSHEKVFKQLLDLMSEDQQERFIGACREIKDVFASLKLPASS